MAIRTEDLSGKRFGRLTVLSIGGKYEPSGNLYWNCQCECGRTTHTTTHSLKTGKSKSCGHCVCSERMSALNTKHGDFGTRLYEIWRQMHRRCYGKNTKAYKDYGGRGITICPEWNDYAVFRDWAVSSGYRDDLTIDRINVNGNYCPENCRWATVKEQANNRRSNHLIEHNGETHTISEWADIYGVEQIRLWDRLKKHDWKLDAALSALGVM